MIPRRLVLAGGLALAARPALALDPGVATGFHERDGERIDLRHAMALRMDNAEDPSEPAERFRLLLSDHALDPSALYGRAFPPVWRMARSGAVRGLLLTVDPADREGLQATILTVPEAGYSLATTTFSNSAGVWARLDVSATRLSGELKPDVSEHMAFSFSAPVFTDEVQADLRGPAAAESEPVRTLVARAEAMGRGDIEAACALSTPESAEGLRSMPPEMVKTLPRMVPQILRRLRGARRVVIRRATAVVVLGPGEWASLTRVDGAWKAAD